MIGAADALVEGAVEVEVDELLVALDGVDILVATAATWLAALA